MCMDVNPVGTPAAMHNSTLFWGILMYKDWFNVFNVVDAEKEELALKGHGSYDIWRGWPLKPSSDRHSPTSILYRHSPISILYRHSPTSIFWQTQSHIHPLTASKQYFKNRTESCTGEETPASWRFPLLPESVSPWSSQAVSKSVFALWNCWVFAAEGVRIFHLTAMIYLSYLVNSLGDISSTLILLFC